ncbi:MAG: hypothetical protein KF767_08950 [Bdellovibrionaceae bacterium]|nr:hypothetical protein [Pseudobdellovibrionaceae bacterium]
MTRPKHTPGPWDVNVYSYPLTPRLFGVNWKQQEKRDASEDLANARLIAAAPEMLEALEDVLAFLNIKRTGIENSLAKQVERALAKARGES